MDTQRHEDLDAAPTRIPAPSGTARVPGMPRSATREIVRRRREAERKLLRHLLHERDGRPFAGGPAG